MLFIGMKWAQRKEKYGLFMKSIETSNFKFRRLVGVYVICAILFSALTVNAFYLCGVSICFHSHLKIAQFKHNLFNGEVDTAQWNDILARTVIPCHISGTLLWRFKIILAPVARMNSVAHKTSQSAFNIACGNKSSRGSLE